ncbi:MAG: hypothetical protein FJY40_05820, partial [Betaproteobacteria bacterium]|nr:hypothetical protein [Betaproteobacteria bacterium]
MPSPAPASRRWCCRRCPSSRPTCSSASSRLPGSGASRSRTRMRAALALLLASACAAAAAEFKTVADNAAVLYDAPSRAAKPLYVVSKHYPLELIVNLDAWVKVRDHTGALTWVERKSLGDRRMVMVTAA